MTATERVTADQLAATLSLVLANPGKAHAQHAYVASFQAYLARPDIDWTAYRGGSGRDAAAALALLLPGRTAVVMFQSQGARAREADSQQDALAALLRDLKTRDLHYAQALVEPNEPAGRELLDRNGFRLLTRLEYMERDATYPWVDPPAPAAAEWIPYSESNTAMFAETMLASYHASLDCPELGGLRPIEDVIASHRATGEFDPSLWEIARAAGQPLGCILLAGHPQVGAFEVVYMGVSSAARRRGIGSLLVRRALERCRSRRTRTLTLVVDSRNEPARHLYERFKFRTIAQRDAYLLRI